MSKDVWIIDPYSDRPEGGWRDGRYFLMGNVLSKNGFRVHLFISNFSHKNKTFDGNGEIISISESFCIVVVPASSYYGHVSWRRVKYERLFALNVTKYMAILPLPHFIILKEPAIFMFDNLKPLFKVSCARLIVDIIDLWPELFTIKLPLRLRFLSSVIFLPFYLKRKEILRYSSGITAVSPDYLSLGISVNNSVPNELVYWGCDFTLVHSLASKRDATILTRLGLGFKGVNEVWGIYAGTLGENYDIETLLIAAKSLAPVFPHLKFLIAGSGPLQDLVISYARENSNIIYLGVLKTHELYELFGFCDFGLSTYTDSSTVSMPIKSFDYFAAGLPLVNSLQRNLGFLIETYNLGYQYKGSSPDSLEQTLRIVLSELDQLFEKKLNCLKWGRFFDNSNQYGIFMKFMEGLDRR